MSSTGLAHHAHRPRPLCEGPGSVPGSQSAPWITHGTTCSSRQNTALRSPAGSATRYPASGRDGRTAPGAGELAHGGQQRTDAPGWLSWLPMALTITVLEGDETGQELLEQALRVLESDVIGIDVELQPFDLSLETRRATDNEIVHEAARAMKEAGLGIKAATITPEGKDDVGSPNRILREEVDGKVIIRTGRRIPGVTPVAGVHYPISVVRMAVEDAYGAKQWREGDEGAGDEVAYRTEKVTRSTCRQVAEYAFRTAEKTRGKVYGGPKWTVSPVYEGMLKEELDAAAARHPNVAYQPVLIDATYAGLIGGAADVPLVIPALNRDGDCLSDLVMPMFGSIAGAESVLLSFDDDLEIDVAMAEAPHGTAPALQGKDIANPMAMLLSVGAVLHYAGRKGAEGAEQASRAIYEAVLEAVSSGVKTPDLGGNAGTTEFTTEVVGRVRTKLEVWGSLGSNV